MAVSGVSGLAVAATGAGAILVWSGIKGANISKTFQSLIGGKQPAGQDPNLAVTASFDAAGNPVVGSGGGGGGTVVSGGSAQAILQKTAAQFGWTGSEWNALAKVEMSEAGFNTKARNPSSGAYGMAQSLGHHFAGGPASNGVNEYGGYGLTPAQSRAASLGDAGAQSLWMCRYIKDRYTTPSKAWAFHLANNWY